MTERETHLDPDDGLFVPTDLREFDRQIIIRTPRATLQHFGTGPLDGYYGLVDASHFGDQDDISDPKNPDLAPDHVRIKPQGEDPVELTVNLETDVVADGRGNHPGDELASGLLEDTANLVADDRDTHGDAVENQQHIAAGWTWYLRGIGVLDNSTALTGADVARMMTLVKHSRGAVGSYDVDHDRDVAGYAAIAAACEVRAGVAEAGEVLPDDEQVRQCPVCELEHADWDDVADLDLVECGRCGSRVSDDE